ncbi:hypothetical protein CYMTET_45140 [Cymbomonas tetramitiformis]|uniref:Uncharacterized protein n=1 Tax=Cymbomonas tetramitiformis TaxID=36881 RepID=A0AAE0C013_9CHLO|nr:hypothetical protein CYMTET_45140 [Cymbomonas tetramitiformis]
MQISLTPAPSIWFDTARIARKLGGLHPRGASKDQGRFFVWHRDVVVVLDSKLEAIAFEYNQLLTQQLDSQRRYFEGLLASSSNETATLRGMEERVEESTRSAKAAVVHAKEMEIKARTFEKKWNEANAQIRPIQEEREFLKQLNEQLMQNQQHFRNKLKEQEAAQKKVNLENEETITDLREQVRDLMVFIQAQRAVADAGEGSDLKDGTVLAVPSPSPAVESDSPGSKGKASGKKGRRK